MINATYHDKLLIFTRATFWEKLVSHHLAVNINCWIRLSLSRLLLTHHNMMIIMTSLWYWPWLLFICMWCFADVLINCVDYDKPLILPTNCGVQCFLPPLPKVTSTCCSTVRSPSKHYSTTAPMISATEETGTTRYPADACALKRSVFCDIWLDSTWLRLSWIWILV